MSELKPCPCGKIPTGLGIGGESAGGKWAEVSGHCCGEWKIEFRTGYHSLDSPEVIAAAMEAWSNAPRGESQRIAELENIICNSSYQAQERIAELEGVIDRLRGQLQNCVNHLERAKRRNARTDDFDACIESANKALYETVEV